jgi:predicted dehydrogenase
VPEPLGVGLIGCGNVATRFHIPAYLAAGEHARVVAVADPVEGHRAEAARILGLPESDAHGAFQDLLARPDVRFVDVSVPQRFHADVALAAIAAGKHVLCEKPITTTPADARRMLDAARAADVLVGMMHNYLFYPEFLAAASVIDAGEIGDVKLAIVNYLGVPDNPGVGEAGTLWRHDPIAAGGGVLVDMIHAVYVTERLIGHQARRVSAYVSGDASHPTVEATALCRLETGGPPALVNVGWGIGPGGVFVEGSLGSLEIRWRDGGTNPFAPLESITVRTAGGVRQLEAVPSLEIGPLVIEGMAGIVRSFAAAVAGGGQPAASGADGLHGLEVALAAYASAATGRTVTIPLEPGDPVFERGVAAIQLLDGPAWSPVVEQQLFTRR